ncbi:caspase family protein [Paracoccus niistensis]|uniref:Caspase family protein n=1 Tax=Paracoccus niistensis TaxID=632935 RepID=A0ABV6I8H5_9RHOB
MTRTTFESVTTNEFQEVVDDFPWTRRITEVHLHHTWRPRQRDYRGLPTLLGMWRYHTETKGWSDIAQHVTVAPDGTIWIGRNFNWAPASAIGFNGNATSGPFMIEMIGDFDHGRESPGDDQWQAVLKVMKSVQTHFNLPAEALRFHNEMSGKTCPGESLDKQQVIRQIADTALPSREGGRAREPFDARHGRVTQILRGMEPGARQTDDMSGAEHPTGEDDGRLLGRASSLGNLVIDPELVNHVINLRRGRFSSGGLIETDQGDVDRIFEEDLPAYINAQKARQRPAHLLFYAHGGLVPESGAVAGAMSQLSFWKRNEIYPVFFIWETGLGETIRQMLEDTVARPFGTPGTRAFFTDPLIEDLVRALQGGRIWDGMKFSAERASADDGGAAYVAAKTAEFQNAHQDDLAIHAVGHSAGAIFHAYFLHRLAHEGGRIKTAHFMAPAITNALFHAALAPLLGEKVGSLTLFTMRKALERADTVSPIYRKSLLYLIHGALERARNTPILGLETSLREDGQTRRIFGLNGDSSPVGSVVWSQSRDEAAGEASLSTTHGGFDNDPATLNSIVRRVLDRQRGEDIVPFSDQGRAADAMDPWSGQVDWPEHLQDFLSAAAAIPPQEGVLGQIPTKPSGTDGGPAKTQVQPVAGTSASGRRIALCIGIDAYERSPLNGCVNDARLWLRTLEGLGYTGELMLNGEATGDRIRRRVGDLVTGARPGESIVIQYAGHGTTMTDNDGDEVEDQCLCAVDCDSAPGGLVVDDELRQIFSGLMEGVALTCFFDCCHSGTATRAALRAQRSLRARSSARDLDIRPRYLPPSEAMKQNYRNRLPALRAGARSAAGPQREILFSACTATELAYENNGQGDFTRYANGVLSQGIGGVANRDFLDRVLLAFGEPRRQNPLLDCSPSRRMAPLLGV